MSEKVEQITCDAKHFSLACWVLGIVLSICVLISVTGARYSMAQTDSMEPRLRKVEETTTRIEERYSAIQKQLDRIEIKVDKLHGTTLP